KNLLLPARSPSLILEKPPKNILKPTMHPTNNLNRMAIFATFCLGWRIYLCKAKRKERVRA
ncbi:MAG: hypothetical protein ACQEQQ_10555, partial [Chloroflexota bacterium]